VVRVGAGVALCVAVVVTTLAVRAPTAARVPIVDDPPPGARTTSILEHHVRPLPLESLVDVPLPAPPRVPPQEVAFRFATRPGADGVIGVIHGGSPIGRGVALTFDMDGGPPSLAIVQWLVDHQVPATFFISGGELDKLDVNRQALVLAAAHPELFELGHHTFSHLELTRLTNAQIAAELDASAARIWAVAGISPLPWLRPPYGTEDPRVVAAARDAGYPLVVLWNVDPADWRVGLTGETVAAGVVGASGPGAIVLLHLREWSTFDALPAIVDGLRANGLIPVRVGDFIAG
jgi:peptidoglycan/xylan/chitin deacetylase (PgdA/CDA1 family)